MLVSVSILSANFANLEKEIKLLEVAGADMLHIDVMDGVFAPNLTFGPFILEHLKKITKLPLDVHLMIDRPERVINDYINSGADIITIHPESTPHIDRALRMIRTHVKAGIALCPATSPHILDYVLDTVDMVLLMTVNPGYAAQKFLLSQQKKIRIVADKLSSYKDIILSVDGGVNDQTALICKQHGANCLVSGSFILADNIDYANKITLLKNGN